jgi:hypothetical protein
MWRATMLHAGVMTFVSMMLDVRRLIPLATMARKATVMAVMRRATMFHTRVMTELRTIAVRAVHVWTTMHRRTAALAHL